MHNYVLLSDGSTFADIEARLRHYLPGLDVRLWQYSPRQAIIRAPLVRALGVEYPHIGVGPLFKIIGIERARQVSDTETVALLAGRDLADLEPRRIVEPASSQAGFDWHLALTRVPQAWALLGGPDQIDWSGVRVGQIDTGYTEHPALGFPAASWVRTDLARSFVPEPSGEHGSILAPELGNGRDNLDGFNAGHGTRIGATISGHAPAAPGGAFYGVAPKVPLVPVRITDTVEITARQREFEQAVRYLVDEAGVQVINLSMGVALGFVVKALRSGVNHAWEHGVILVCAAGNHTNKVVAPARLDRTLAIAGVTSAEAPWSGSSFGPTVDISGPAADLRRADVKGQPGAAEYSYATGGDGTSYATGMTTGAAALWLAHRGAEIAAAYPLPWQRVAAFIEIARRSAHVPPIWEPGSFGTGVLDVEGVLKAPLPAVATLVDQPAA
jgi:Subtilase family